MERLNSLFDRWASAMARFMLLAALLAVTAVPAGAQDAEPETLDGDIVRPRCLWTPSILDTEVIDNRTVIVRVTGGRRYRMVLAHECYGLKFHGSFYYRLRTNQLCTTDVIIARGGSNCPIDYFELIAEQDAKSKSEDAQPAP